MLQRLSFKIEIGQALHGYFVGQWTIHRMVLDDDVIGTLYLYPDGAWRPSCWRTQDLHAYYPSRQAAVDLLEKYRAGEIDGEELPEAPGSGS